MKRRLICILLCVLLLLSLTACGGSGQTAKTEDTAPIVSTGISFREAYMTYANIRDAMVTEVNTRINTHNDILRAEQPDSYLLNSDLLLIAFAPFGTIYPELGRDLCDDTMEAVLASLQKQWPDAQLALTAPGCYEATYTYVDRTSGSDVERDGKCVWECDGETGALRVCAYLDGVLQEFTEFVPQGDNRYLLSTHKDRAIVEYSNDAVTALWLEHRIYEMPFGTFGGDLRALQPENGAYPDGEVSIDQIVGDADAQYIFTLEQGTMMYKGKIPQNILDNDGNQTGVSWFDTDAVTLRS